MQTLFAATAIFTVASAILFARLGRGRFTVFGGVLTLVVGFVLLLAIVAAGSWGWSKFPCTYWTGTETSGLSSFSQWTAQRLAVAAAWCVVAVLVLSSSGLCQPDCVRGASGSSVGTCPRKRGQLIQPNR